MTERRYIGVRDLHPPRVAVRCYRCGQTRDNILALRDCGRREEKWWATVYLCCGHAESAQTVRAALLNDAAEAW